ncbi:hypothetical protein PHMEG_00010121 [Phytophthora megakarya]|uniref:AB hydrolase-1 domain-containing protein n=1 Tax=Phytophthora megakarya TaxID=4795 RepID=A0A225WGJ5_9STRA|nr:hypothetical protein PHMEG_00010121 [Phytophthora megakarya]
MALSRLEQHMASKYVASRVYTPETVQKVKVATGITMGYLIQAVDGLFTQWEAEYPDKMLKVLTFDNRGVGDSDAPCGRYSTSGMAQDTLALLDVIGWRTAHIAGASLGGMISQEIALLAPERVQSLSLVATSSGSFIPAVSAYASIFTTMMSADPTKVTNAILSFLYPEPFLSSKNGGNGTMHDVFFKYHKMMVVAMGAPSSFGAVGQSAAAMFHRVSDAKLRRIRDRGFPILIIGAKLDKCINVSHALHFKKVFASDHTKFVLYDDAGHGCLLQHIDQIAGNLIEVMLSSSLSATDNSRSV